MYSATNSKVNYTALRKSSYLLYIITHLLAENYDVSDLAEILLEIIV